MPVVTAAEWDDFLKKHPDAHLLQTGAWGMLKQAFGWHAERVIAHTPQGDIGAQVLFRRLLSLFSIAYIPKGPVGLSNCLVSTGAWKTFLNEVDDLCRRQHSILVKIEPDCWQQSLPGKANPSKEMQVDLDQSGAIPSRGLVLSSHSIQPPRTIVIDIAPSEEEILNRMKQKTRYNIRLAHKKGVEIQASEDLESFYRLMTTTGERDAFGVHSLDYFRQAYQLFKPSKQVELFLASHEGQVLAGLMAFRSGQRAWYLYGASSNEKRELMPAYLLQWEAIRWAKSHGCTEYDLWGVPDANEDELEAHFSERSDGLWGVYRFKRGFGGQLRRAACPWDRVYQPLLYQLYRWRAARVSE